MPLLCTYFLVGAWLIYFTKSFRLFSVTSHGCFERIKIVNANERSKLSADNTGLPIFLCGLLCIIDPAERNVFTFSPFP